MVEQTPLDIAHARMVADDTDDVARLGYYERVADTELFLLLDHEPTDENVSPHILTQDDQSFVLVFDREDRLSEFWQGTAPYVSLSGRGLVQMLRGQGLGLGINLGTMGGAFLLPPNAVDWLADTLDHPTETGQGQLAELLAPTGLPERVLQGLDTKLALAAGLAKQAYLMQVTYTGGQRSHLLGIIDAVPGSETALAQSVSEALRFSGLDAGQLDVAFFDADDPICARMARVGLRFDIPEPEPQATAPGAPGMDPDKPPKLR